MMTKPPEHKATHIGKFIYNDHNHVVEKSIRLVDFGEYYQEEGAPWKFIKADVVDDYINLRGDCLPRASRSLQLSSVHRLTKEDDLRHYQEVSEILRKKMELAHNRLLDAEHTYDMRKLEYSELLAYYKEVVIHIHEIKHPSKLSDSSEII